MLSAQHVITVNAFKGCNIYADHCDPQFGVKSSGFRV
jgi:hypothetical protein